MSDELDRLRVLRYFFDRSIDVLDPVEFAYHQRQLLLAIAEHLLQPLQEHEYAERNKLQGEIDESF